MLPCRTLVVVPQDDGLFLIKQGLARTGEPMRYFPLIDASKATVRYSSEEVAKGFCEYAVEMVDRYDWSLETCVEGFNHEQFG